MISSNIMKILKKEHEKNEIMKIKLLFSLVSKYNFMIKILLFSFIIYNDILILKNS